MRKIILILLVFTTLSSCHKKAIFQRVETTITYQPKELFQLNNLIDESSGLDVYDGLIYTLNDSGGEPIVFVLNQDGELVNQIPIKNAKNSDWESLDINDKLLSVGDFGNNRGNRDDLLVYQVPLDNLNQEPSTISFSYKAQTIFDFENLTTPYDCEALFSDESDFFIISKNWKDGNSSLYNITSSNSTPLTAKETYQFDALVTGADYNKEREILACSGYADFEMYVFLFLNSTPEKYFSDEVIKIHLDNLSDAQVEGICFLDNNHLLISTEKTKIFKPQVWRLDLSELIQ